MLISDMHQFVVALPTKCGTHSMRNMGIKWEHAVGYGRELKEWPTLRHRLIPPEHALRYKRAMVVRDPYERVVSAFNYLLSHKNEWHHDELQAWLGRYGIQETFRLWTELLMAERDRANSRGWFRRNEHGIRPYIWTDSLRECEDYLGGVASGGWEQPVHILRLETLARDWDVFLDVVGWITPRGAERPVPGHYNKASRANGAGQLDGWDAVDCQVNAHLMELLHGDADHYGYPVRA